MSKMIRCIEGHVFDANSHAKCPNCGWVPSKSEKKPKQRAESGASFGQKISGFFSTLIGTVEHALSSVGIRNKPGLAAGIVYAGMILLLVTGASALPGSPLWPGNWGKGTEASPGMSEKAEPEAKDKSAAKSETPPPSPTPTPEKKKQPDKKTADTDGPGTDPTPASQEKPRRNQQNPNIHVPRELRRLLNRIF